MASITINGQTFHMSDRAYQDMCEGARMAEEARLEAIRCPICHGVNEHTLSCPTRWY